MFATIKITLQVSFDKKKKTFKKSFTKDLSHYNRHFRILKLADHVHWIPAWNDSVCMLTISVGSPESFQPFRVAAGRSRSKQLPVPEKTVLAVATLPLSHSYYFSLNFLYFFSLYLLLSIARARCCPYCCRCCLPVLTLSSLIVVGCFVSPRRPPGLVSTR